jgi:hypothetical protein
MTYITLSLKTNCNNYLFIENNLLIRQITVDKEQQTIIH